MSLVDIILQKLDVIVQFSMSTYMRLTFNKIQMLVVKMFERLCVHKRMMYEGQ